MSKDVPYGSRGTVAASVGQRLRTLRKTARMTQSQLGQSLGVDARQISRYESGTDHLGPEGLAEVARLFDVPTEELLHQETAHAESEDAPPDLPSHPPREAVERWVAALEDVLRRRATSAKPRPGGKRRSRA